MLKEIVQKNNPVLREKAKEILVKDIKEFPIPNWESAKELIPLVESILNLRKSDPNIDTKDIESKIDEIVYRIYGLNEVEIEIIEKN